MSLIQQPFPPDSMLGMHRTFSQNGNFFFKTVKDSVNSVDFKILSIAVLAGITTAWMNRNIPSLKERLTRYGIIGLVGVSLVTHLTDITALKILICITLFCVTAGGMEYLKARGDRVLAHLVTRAENREGESWDYEKRHLFYTKCPDFPERLLGTDLRKFGEEIRKNHSRYKELNLNNIGLNDRALQEMGEFTNISLDTLDIGYNSITFKGLKEIGIPVLSDLKTLCLAGNSTLTDTDLEEMAASTYFQNLIRLDISNCPCLTGRSSQILQSKGFENLRWLDISGNKRMIEEQPDCFLGSKFKLETLEARDMLTTVALEKMLQNEWFCKLKGLNISYCFENQQHKELEKLPATIQNLTALESPFPTYDNQQGVYFHGEGLLCFGWKFAPVSYVEFWSKFKGKIWGFQRKA